MTTTRTSRWRGFWASALLAAAICAPAHTQKQNEAASPQGMLDFLAKPMPAGSMMSMPDSYPRRFADWTEAQRKSGLQFMIQRCGLAIALEHDNPASRIVPQTMTKLEEAELAIGVCLPAHMPGDWSERRKYLEDAQRLISKANSYGATLHLPKDLVEN